MAEGELSPPERPPSVHGDVKDVSKGIVSPSHGSSFATDEKHDPSNETSQVKSEANDGEDANAEPDVGVVKFAFVLGPVVLVSFLILLDVSIVSTAIPRITDEFRSLNDVGWYGAAYQLASGALLPLTGKIYQYFHLKWTYLFCFGIFEFGSFICALSTSSPMLIVGRAIAGMGGAGLQNGGLTIISNCVPLQKRPLYLGMMIGISQLGVVIAPIIGGAFTSYVSWRWCFWINLPIGAVVVILMIFIKVPDPIKKDKFSLTIRTVWPKLDLIGFAIFVPFAIMLLLGLHYGGVDYPWNSPTVIGLLVGGGLCLIIFIIWEYRVGEGAMIPMTMLMKRIIWASCLNMLFMGSTNFVSSYYLPIYFQSVKGTTPVQSGINVLPNIISSIISSVGSGALVGVVGYYLPFAVACGILISIATGLLSLLAVSTPSSFWIGAQVLLGFGRNLGSQIPMVSVQNHLPPKDLPVSMAMLIFSMTFGSAIWLTVANTIFTNSLSSQIVKRVQGLDPAVVIGAGATNIRVIVGPDQLPGVIDAYASALRDVWYLVLAFGIMCFITAWLLGWKDLRQKKKPQQASEE